MVYYLMNKDTTIAELDCINNDGEIVFNVVNILGIGVHHQTENMQT